MVAKKGAKKGSGLTLRTASEKKPHTEESKSEILQKNAPNPGSKKRKAQKPAEDQLPAKKPADKKLKLASEQKMEKLKVKKEQKGQEDASKAVPDAAGKKGAAAKRQKQRTAKKHARFAVAGSLDEPGSGTEKTASAAGGGEEKPAAAAIRRAPGHPLRVFVGGLPKVANLDAQAVRAHFAECGDIKEFSLPLNSRKLSMGIAFITFSSQRAVASVLQRSGSDFMGAKISVKRDVGVANKVKIASISNKVEPGSSKPADRGKQKGGVEGADAGQGGGVGKNHKAKISVKRDAGVANEVTVASISNKVEPASSQPADAGKQKGGVEGANAGQDGDVGKKRKNKKPSAAKDVV